MTNAVLPLYALADEYELLGQRLLEAEGELTPELGEAWDKLSEDIDSKVENTALFIRNLEATARAEEEEAERFANRARTKRNAVKSLKMYLKLNLERVGRDKIETLRVKARIQINPRPSISWPGQVEHIPDPFKRTKVELDGNAVYQVWKTDPKGVEADGFKVERGTHLRLS